MRRFSSQFNLFIQSFYNFCFIRPDRRSTQVFFKEELACLQNTHTSLHYLQRINFSKNFLYKYPSLIYKRPIQSCNEQLIPFFFFGDMSSNPDILSGLYVGWISGSSEFLTDNDEGKGGSSKSGLALSLNVILVTMAADAELVGLFFCLTFTGSQPNETSQSCGADRTYINKNKYWCNKLSKNHRIPNPSYS